MQITEKLKPSPVHFRTSGLSRLGSCGHKKGSAQLDSSLRFAAAQAFYFQSILSGDIYIYICMYIFFFRIPAPKPQRNNSLYFPLFFCGSLSKQFTSRKWLSVYLRFGVRQNCKLCTRDHFSFSSCTTLFLPPFFCPPPFELFRFFLLSFSGLAKFCFPCVVNNEEIFVTEQNFN